MPQDNQLEAEMHDLEDDSPLLRANPRHHNSPDPNNNLRQCDIVHRDKRMR